MTNQQPDQTATTIGMRLRTAREQQGLTLKDVGRQLKLPANLIEALETDRTGSIAPVYLKGYLRSYARFLDLDEQPLCAELPAGQTASPSLQPALPSGSSYTWLESTGKVAGYLVVTAFVVAPLVWWFTQGAVRLSFDENLVESQPLSQQAASLPASNDPALLNAERPDAGAGANDAHVQASAAPFLSLRNTDNGNDNGEAVDQADAQTDAPPAAQTDGADTGPLTETTAIGTGTDGQSPAQQSTGDQTDINAAATDAPADDATFAADTDGDRLRLQMLNDSWVEITDADGQRLEYDLLSAGRIKSYAGKAPFKLLFGRASAVELYLNDQYVDLSPYTRGNVASTTLASNRSAAENE